MRVVMRWTFGTLASMTLTDGAAHTKGEHAVGERCTAEPGIKLRAMQST